MAAEGNLYDDFDEAFSEGGEEEEDESEGEEEPFDLAAALAGGGVVEGVVEGTRLGAGPAVPVVRGRRAPFATSEEEGWGGPVRRVRVGAGGVSVRVTANSLRQTKTDPKLGRPTPTSIKVGARTYFERNLMKGETHLAQSRSKSQAGQRRGRGAPAPAPRRGGGEGRSRRALARRNASPAPPPGENAERAAARERRVYCN